MKVSDEELAYLYKELGSYGAVARKVGMDRRGVARRLRKEDNNYKAKGNGIRKHIVIPDCQVKDGVDISYLEWIGKYIVDQEPDVVIQLGDFADMPSLSSYDKGKKCFEGRRYKKDIAASRRGMELLVAPIWRSRVPEMHLVYGNHEARITRAVELEPILEDIIQVEDLCYDEYGWQVHEFLEPVSIDGVLYCHYYTSGVMGLRITTASALLTKKHQTCIAGHQQGKQIAYAIKADGRSITGLIAGSCYLHNEDFLGPQGNKHWRGIIVLHEVNDGQFDEMFVSLDYLRRRYGK